jgi:hypothetical protein
MGITMLMCLVSLPAVDARDSADDMLEDPRRAPEFVQAAAEWPDRLAVELAKVVVGLSWRRLARQRMPLPEALRRIEGLSDEFDIRPGSISEAASPALRECVVCMSAPRSVRFTCGHCCCCGDCAERLMNAQPPLKCPSCRAPIAVLFSHPALGYERTYADPSVDVNAPMRLSDLPIIIEGQANQSGLSAQVGSRRGGDGGDSIDGVGGDSANRAEADGRLDGGRGQNEARVSVQF